MKYILRSVNTETLLINKLKPKFLKVIRIVSIVFLCSNWMLLDWTFIITIIPMLVEKMSVNISLSYIYCFKFSSKIRMSLSVCSVWNDKLIYFASCGMMRQLFLLPLPCLGGYMQLRIFIVFLNFKSYSPLILLHISKEAVGL